MKFQVKQKKATQLVNLGISRLSLKDAMRDARETKRTVLIVTKEGKRKGRKKEMLC